MWRPRRIRRRCWSTRTIRCGGLCAAGFGAHARILRRGRGIHQGQRNRGQPGGGGQAHGDCCARPSRTGWATGKSAPATAPWHTSSSCGDNRVYEYRQQGLSASEAQSATARYVAVPGSSEHHTGLAFDVTVPGESFPLTEQSKWLAEHCWDYGFIIRYTEEKKISRASAPNRGMCGMSASRTPASCAENWCLEEYIALPDHALTDGRPAAPLRILRRPPLPAGKRRVCAIRSPGRCLGASAFVCPAAGVPAVRRADRCAFASSRACLCPARTPPAGRP